MFGEMKSFFENGIWRIQISRLRGRESFSLHFLRVFSLSIKKFRSDQCILRASALTFYTLLSIVPALALVLGVAKGFGLQQALEAWLIKIPAHELVMIQVLEFARNMLLHSKSGIIAGAGVVFLLWTVLKVLGNVEQSFNDIWGVKQGRSFTRRFSDYFSLMLVCPLLIIPASGITVFISAQVQSFSEQYRVFQLLDPVFMVGLVLLPYLLLCALLTFIYIFMPSARVKFSSALTGAFVAGTFYQLIQWAYIHFQINVAQFNAVYGSFAAFPLFLIWLQLSWAIVLYGAEIAYAKQYEATYELEPEAREASTRLKSIVALMLAAHSSRLFHELKEPPSLQDFYLKLEFPMRLIQDSLHLLLKAHVLSVVRNPDSAEEKYQPGRPIETLTVKNVLEAIECAGTNSLTTGETPETQKYREIVERLWERVQNSPENLLLKDIPIQKIPESLILKHIHPLTEGSGSR